MISEKPWRAMGLILVVMAALWTAALPQAVAEERSAEEVSRITRQVSQDVYSPYCPGQTLAMCPSSNASYARQDIQEMARQGMSAEAITAEMIDRYGEEYAVVEPSSADQLWLIGAIAVGLLLAIVAVAFMARRRRGDDDEKAGGDAGDGVDGELDDQDPLLADLRAEYRD